MDLEREGEVDGSGSGDGDGDVGVVVPVTRDSVMTSAVSLTPGSLQLRFVTKTSTFSSSPNTLSIPSPTSTP